MVVDRELAIRVCPKCAVTSTFASHIFESKDMEKGESSSRQQSLNHMQKFSMQFERGHPSTPLDVLEAMSVAYSRIHLHDPSKVQACRTSNLLKTVRVQVFCFCCGYVRTYFPLPCRFPTCPKRSNVPQTA
jgi:hypothetical protein